MDKRLLRLFVAEIGLQCRLALFAYRRLEELLEPYLARQFYSAGEREGEPAFFYAHAFLTHTANISKILWPAKKSEARASAIKSKLGIVETSLLRSREFRNQLEHFDERLEKWTMESDTRYPLDAAIGPRSANGSYAELDNLRYLDPQTMVFYSRGEKYLLSTIAQGLQELEKSVQPLFNMLSL